MLLVGISQLAFLFLSVEAGYDARRLGVRIGLCHELRQKLFDTYKLHMNKACNLVYCEVCYIETPKSRISTKLM